MNRAVPLIITAACFAAALVPDLAAAQEPAQEPSEREQSERPEQGSADEVCGSDRRCRLDRLKRVNMARRYEGMLRQEEQARRMQEAIAKRKRESKPRLTHPLSFDYFGTNLGALGVAIGYGFTEHVRLEGTFTYGYPNVYTTSSSDDFYIDQVNIGLHGVYILGDGIFSPYVGAGFVYSTGRVDYSFIDGGASSGTRILMHVVRGSIGLDLQVKAGLHLRLGFVARVAPYTQARISPGSYDQEARETAEEWFQQRRVVGPDIMIGWAF